MENFLQFFALEPVQWLWVIVAAFLVGFSKTGISGFTMLVIPILATVFGGKDSTGIMLPMLIIGDIFAVFYYQRHAKWKDIVRLLPWAFVGILAGLFVGNLIDDHTFKLLIAVIVLICLVLLIRVEIKGDPGVKGNLASQGDSGSQGDSESQGDTGSKGASEWKSTSESKGDIESKLTRHVLFAPLTGVASGFATMIGNAAGPIFSLYLLAKGAKKNNYMGTFAWFFLIVNVTKLPLQIFAWKNITVQTLAVAGLMIPAITIGALLGVAVIKRLNEKPFRWIIIGVTAIAAFRLFF